jgi:hypothetical protein
MNKKKTQANMSKLQKQKKIPSLATLSEARTGGAINIRGINFQLLYATYVILSNLTPNSNVKVKLEGLEDIDILGEVSNLYIQTKTSINQIEAGKLWELHVLQNFMHVYINQPEANFKLVHNTGLNKGKLDIFLPTPPSEEIITFWFEKFITAEYVITRETLKLFFSQINAESITEANLKTKIIKLLFDYFDINNETETIFLNALFYNITQWSKNRDTVAFNDLNRLIQAVKDSFSKSPTNPALQNNWVSKVSYSIKDSLSVNDYFEGKAARPIHISMGLPARRPSWESEIVKTISEAGITIIRSSSGQGKSTLAWLVGQTLSIDGYSIYQINQCAQWDQANAIADFLETRLKIGEIPLVIIDGLNQTVSAWDKLIDYFIDKPVKILLTTREEDWNRYGGDTSKMSHKFIDIKLTIAEAEAIFVELNRNNKVDVNITSWQPSWERIEDKGLLIEYVYLLTSGQLISERLSYQVSQLKNDRSNSSKLEILRLISLADVFNIKIKTRNLTDHINNTVRFDSDKNEVYRELEKEYYLKFN